MAKTYYRVIRKLAFEKGPQSDAPKPYFNALLRSLPNPATRWLNNVSVTPVIGSRIWVQRAMRGTHEPALDLLLAASLRPGDLMVDVGAQKGLVTVMAAKLVGSAGRVIAIEPDQSNITIFREALKRNAATNVELRPVAASSHNGKGWYVREAYAGLISASNQNEEGIGSLIDTVRLDSMLMEAKALPRLVKVDVDGPEMDVVIGLGELLNRSDAPVLAVECSRYWERFGWTFGRAHRYLAERGYRIAVGHRTADRLSWIEDPASLPAGWGTLKGLAFNFFCFKPGSHDDVIAEWATKYQ
jgi:FkbM family methyltransferase